MKTTILVDFQICISVPLSCFVDFISRQNNKYMFKVNNKKIDLSACVQS